MAETIYIDSTAMDGAIGIIFKRETKVVYTGLELLTEEDGPFLEEVSRLCGVHFLPGGRTPEVPLYGVPCLEVFASDGQGGWFAMANHLREGAVCHIGRDLTVHLAAANRSELINSMVADPDWRRKRLPGGPWPALPEDPGGRKGLAEKLGVPIPLPENAADPGPLPQVFSSRTEAEREFAIQDVWTVLRQKKEPRFQVHAMMSPADREGRALVHFAAWREAYTGLMPEAALAAHTLERCREALRQSGSRDTFVALDRENGDRVVGFGTLSYFARDFVSVPDAGEIVALYVLEEFQGNGLGRRLMESCLAWLPRPRVALFVLEGNQKAIGFYEHMGFRLTGHTIEERIAGETVTELEMVLEKNAG